tara:strand:+ start:457 stop:582 length:126 start_codon:yes stop_codon:yes gene_type:complete
MELKKILIFLTLSVANFLLSDNSSWITGQILGVDGGRSSLT